MCSIADENSWIAVLGGGTHCDRRQISEGYLTGRELARKGKRTVTWATTGIPYAAGIGGKEEGGNVVGISPASSLAEHAIRSLVVILRHG